MSAEAEYTVWIESKDRDADDQVLARGLTVAEAAELICKYANANPYIRLSGISCGSDVPLPARPRARITGCRSDSRRPEGRERTGE